MYEDLLIFLEPSIGSTEFDIDQSLEFACEVLGYCTLCAAIFDDNAVDDTIVRGEGFFEEIFGKR